MYSGGRDQKVWATDLRNPEIRTLVCEEKAPILKVGFVQNQQYYLVIVYCESHWTLLLIRLLCMQSFCAMTRIFCDDYVNTMADDDLAP